MCNLVLAILVGCGPTDAATAAEIERSWPEVEVLAIETRHEPFGQPDGPQRWAVYFSADIQFREPRYRLANTSDWIAACDLPSPVSYPTGMTVYERVVETGARALARGDMAGLYDDDGIFRFRSHLLRVYATDGQRLTGNRGEVFGIDETSIVIGTPNFDALCESLEPPG